MTTTAVPPATSRPTTTDTRTFVRRARVPLIVVGAFVVVAAVTAINATNGVGTLDTDSASKTGSRAIAELLRDQGHAVKQVRTVDLAAATPGGTLVVVGADLLTPDAATRVASSGATTVVVVGATDTELVKAFAPGAEVIRPVDEDVRDPACALPAAGAAGSADVGGAVYRAPAAIGTTITGCYPVGGDPSLLDLRTPSRHVVLVGSPQALKNEHLDDVGNAALALNVLGADGDVTWYLPSLDDIYGPGQAPADDKTVLDLVPHGVIGGVVWLGVVVVLLALWRARRLGPVVSEALPVVVRASETVEGRARLYRRANDRTRAADLMRGATRDRLVPALGLAPGSPRAQVVEATVRRTGRPAAQVDALLYGAGPSDDAHLVSLIDALDRLDEEVHRT